MEKIIRLNQNDIQKIVAKHFGVANICQVEIEPYTTTEGYGMSEHSVIKVRAEVLINDEEIEQ